MLDDDDDNDDDDGSLLFNVFIFVDIIIIVKNTNKVKTIPKE